MHPLADVVNDALHGTFPPVDGRVERLPGWRPGVEAAVSFTGHGYLCLGDDRVVPPAVADLARDGFGGMTDPRVVAALAGPGAGADDIDSLDVLLAAPGGPSADAVPLVAVAGADHPRIAFAQRLRDDLEVLAPSGLDDALVVLGRGVAGLREVSIEVAARHRGTGLARALLQAARTRVPADETLVAMVAPGNAASLRTVLAAGFTPLGSAQLWHVT